MKQFVVQQLVSSKIFKKNLKNNSRILSVSYKYSITAAHCVNFAKSFGLANVHLHVGRQNVTADVYADTPYSEQYIIETAVTHPSYSSVTGVNDIGYIKTKTDIRFR